MSEVTWRGWVHSGALKSHQRWFDGGRRGEGRLVVVGKDLHGMGPVADLRGARFVRCNLTDAKLIRAMCDGIELAGCVFTDAQLGEADFIGGRIEDCCFDGANLGLANLSEAEIRLGSWQRIVAEHSRWQGTQCTGVDFRDARFDNPVLDGADFDRCDFRGAELRRGDTKFDLGTAYDTVFRQCDFRGADLTGLRLRDTLFDRCLFDGVRGRPKLEGECDVYDADVDVLASWRA